MQAIGEAAERGIGSDEVIANENELVLGGGGEAGFFLFGADVREGGEEEAAGAGGGGFVARRGCAGAAVREEFGVVVGEFGAAGGGGIDEAEEVFARGDIGERVGGDIAFGGDAVGGVEFGGGRAEEFFDFGGGPEMGSQGVVGGRVFDGGAVQVVDGVKERVASGFAKSGIAGELGGVDERKGDAGLVGEGLLEVGLAVFGVAGVAEEAAVERIADGTGDEGAEGDQRGFASGRIGEEEAEEFGLEVFRRIAEAAVGGVVEAEVSFAGFREEARAIGGGERGGGLGGEKGFDGGEGFVGFGALGVCVGLPAGGGAFGDGEEAFLTPFLGGREVVGAFEGFQFGREPEVEREAVELFHVLRVALVEGDEVGALVGVDGDADEGLVEERGGVGVAEGLFQHGAAELAGGEADENEERFLFGLSAREGIGRERLEGNGCGGAGAEEDGRGVSERGRGAEDGGGQNEEEREEGGRAAHDGGACGCEAAREGKRKTRRLGAAGFASGAPASRRPTG